MIAAELRGGNKPGLNEALGWIGSRVDDIYGANVGRLDDVWIDPGTGMPRWLLVKEGRFGGRTTLIPFEDATAGAGHVWIPYEREAVRTAPEVEPGAPLTQSVESALRDHFRGVGGKQGERRSQTASPRPSYRHVPPAQGQPPQHVHAQPTHVPAYAHHAEPHQEAPTHHHHDAFALQGTAPQRTYAHTAGGAPIAGLRPNPNQPPAQPPVEAGPPEALGIPVPPQQPQPNPDEGSAFGQARLQPAHDAQHQAGAPAPAPVQVPLPPQPRAPQYYVPPAQQQPQPQQHQGQYPVQQQRQRPQQQFQAPAYAPPQQQAPQPPPQYAPPPQQPQYAPPPAPQQRQPEPAPAPRAMPPAPQPAPPAGPLPAYAPPQAAHEPAPGPRPLEPADNDPPVAIPVIHALDRPQRIEIELAGELRISGELKGFSIKPVTPEPPSGEQS